MADTDNIGWTTSLEQSIPDHGTDLGLSAEDVKEIQEQCRVVRSGGPQAPATLGKLQDTVANLQQHPNYTESVGERLGLLNFSSSPLDRKSNSGQGMGGGASVSIDTPTF